MYDRDHGVTVRVLPCRRKGGKPKQNGYKEYKIPYDSKISGVKKGKNVAFIIAEPGDRFVVEAKIRQSFPWRTVQGKRKAINFELEIDGMTVSDEIVLDKSDMDSEGTDTTLFDTVRRFSEEKGEWFQHTLHFAETKLLADPDALTDEEEQAEIEKRGVIRLRLVTGTSESGPKKSLKVRLAQAAAAEENALSAAKLGDMTSEKVAIKHGRSQHTSFVPRSIIPAKELFEHLTCSFDKQKNADLLEYTIYYTTRGFLERQGIIPSQNAAVTIEDDTNAQELHATPATSVRTPSVIPQNPRREIKTEPDTEAPVFLSSTGVKHASPATTTTNTAASAAQSRQKLKRKALELKFEALQSKEKRLKMRLDKAGERERDTVQDELHLATEQRADAEGALVDLDLAEMDV